MARNRKRQKRNVRVNGTSSDMPVNGGAIMYLEGGSTA